MSTTIIKAKDIRKSFTDGLTVTEVLKGVDLEISEGEFVAIMGRSGAGKSTLLYQLSLLDTPTSGSISLDGRLVDHLSNTDKTRFRLHTLGYVFQDYSLLPELTAEENIMVPLLMQGLSRDTSKKRAQEALESVNLLHRKDNTPSELSGGEQQRVSIARAITHKPKILFADEPTANLDSFSSNIVMDIFRKLNKNDGLTIVMVTHEPEYGKLADRIIKLSDGQVVA
ncbi:MAG: ABC transporter ATP-binding protein [Candidatus Pacebacteria bacterium]|nr:ABC transporter ATP-binding protein [Candidatus Paceibacterota bacterium]